jgi:folate-binding protein YgfZ
VPIVTHRVAARPRAFVRVHGPDAADFLQRMLSNDVEQDADVFSALLLTPKGRIIAPLRVWRRGPDDFLLLTEPELGEAVRSTLQRARFAAKCEIEPEEHDSAIVFGVAEGLPGELPGTVEVLDAELDETVDEEELERFRIETRVPRWGRELDESVLPAEAGLDRTHISFSKGCYPGQEPIARLHYRGHVNRGLRVLDVDGAHPGDEVRFGEKVVGRVTSAVAGVALAYVRAEVPDGADVDVGGRPATSRPRPSG